MIEQIAPNGRVTFATALANAYDGGTMRIADLAGRPDAAAPGRGGGPRARQLSSASRSKAATARMAWSARSTPTNAIVTLAARARADVRPDGRRPGRDGREPGVLAHADLARDRQLAAEPGARPDGADPDLREPLARPAPLALRRPRPSASATSRWRCRPSRARARRRTTSRPRSARSRSRAARTTTSARSPRATMRRRSTSCGRSTTSTCSASPMRRSRPCSRPCRRR